MKPWRMRKSLGAEVVEQEVYGIDPFTHNLVLDTMPVMPPMETDDARHAFIEDVSRTLHSWEPFWLCCFPVSAIRLTADQPCMGAKAPVELDILPAMLIEHDDICIDQDVLLLCSPVRL